MRYVVSLNGKDYEVEVEHGQAHMISVSDTAAPAAAQGAPAATPQAVPAPAPAAAAAPTAQAFVPAGGEVVRAPMPGTILSIKVSPGAPVKRGDVLLILEAMKMENEIVAPADGVVAQVAVTSGATVDAGDALAVLR